MIACLCVASLGAIFEASKQEEDYEGLWTEIGKILS